MVQDFHNSNGLFSHNNRVLIYAKLSIVFKLLNLLVLRLLIKFYRTTFNIISGFSNFMAKGKGLPFSYSDE